MKDFIKQFFDIKFWKFVLVGVINTIIGTGTQFALYNATPLKDIATTGTWIASSVSYVLASIVSYFLNKHFTFKNTEKGWKPIFRFALNIAICYLIAYGIAIPFTSYICEVNNLTMFGWPVDVFASNVSMLVGSGLFVVLNYIGQRFFAFKTKE